MPSANVLDDGRQVVVSRGCRFAADGGAGGIPLPPDNLHAVCAPPLPTEDDVAGAGVGGGKSVHKKKQRMQSNAALHHLS
jgi:hypothetical protein